nr:DegT/DnrJ/EryC1/StrS family aminotransferase [Hyphomicrobiales bacterium]
YDDALAELPLTTPVREHRDYSSFHLYIIRLDMEKLALHTHPYIFEALRGKGVLVNLHYIPVYRHPYFRRLGFCPSDFPQAERYYAEAISLPLYPTLSHDDQDFVVKCLRQELEP